jgi:hypothetical protein
MITSINEFHKTIQTEELSKRDQSIINRGMLIITKSQLALCYLVAMERINGKVPEFSRKLVHDYSIECGMNPETFRRTCNKFEGLIEGKEEDEEFTNKEFIYKKIKNAFAEFVEMKEPEIYALAESALTEENQKIGLKVAADKDAASDMYKTNLAQRELVVFNKLESVYRALEAMNKRKSPLDRINNKTLKERVIVKTVKELMDMPEFIEVYSEEGGLEKLNKLANNMWHQSGLLRPIK